MNKCSTFCASLLLSITPVVHAAGPLMHLYIGNLFWSALQNKQKYKAPAETSFLAGNIFPDIRYLGAVPRQATHSEDTSISHIFQKSPFVAGMKLHSYVDLTREELAERFGIYNFMTEVPRRFHASALKILEDVILFEQGHQNFSYPIKGLPEEIGFHKSLDQKHVDQWHHIVNTYLKNPETFVSSPQAMGMFGSKLDPQTQRKISAWIKNAKENTIFKSYMEAQKVQYERLQQAISLQH